MDERYIEKRKQVERFFVPENKIANSGKVDVCPTGNFQIEITPYSTTPKALNYSRGIVTRIPDGTVIADIKRNHVRFWHTWLEHPNGNEYLLCGEDYQGYSIVNLTAGKYQVYFPEQGHKGWGFCWAVVYPSPDRLVLAVDGCYWACPYDLVLFDFRDPETLPYPELARFNGLDDCEGWVDNGTFRLKHEVGYRKSDDALYDSLSPEEQEVLDKDDSLVGYRYEIIDFKRPSFK